MLTDSTGGPTTGPAANPSRSLITLQDTGISLYVHVPFCQTKCPYCDFNTYQGIEGLMSPYLDALLAEITAWGRALGHPPINTIFFGGGTPSYLPDGALGRIIATANRAFSIRKEAEITAEANPGDLTPVRAASLFSQGMNRLSIGVQSLDNDLLNLLGRRHDADQAIASFGAVRDAGFDNVNLDLIYGLPRQSLAQWQETLQRLAALEPAHVSLYCLTVEEGTPLHRWVERGEVPRPDPDLAADMYQHARELLGSQGYHHYEISNWSKPGLASRHNLAYWRNLPYLGVSPGAHSCLGGYRFWDMDSPRGYIEAAQRWASEVTALPDKITAAWLDIASPVGGYESIDDDLAASETMFLGLRLLDGLDLAEASSRVGADLAVRYGPQLTDLVELGLLERKGTVYWLHPSSYLIANQVFERFLD